MSSNASAPSRPYIASGGRVLESPPLSARLSSLGTHVYNALGLYVTSFLALDPYTTAQNSQFNIHNRGSSGRSSGGSSFMPRAPWGGSGGGNGGSGPGNGGGGAGRRIGRVDDVRGPECGSCQ